jgi:hypothetical protein
MLSNPTSRCGVSPIWIEFAGSVHPRTATQTSAWGNQPNRSGPTPGTRTPRKRPKATATAAMVPVWITTKNVQP